MRYPQWRNLAFLKLIGALQVSYCGNLIFFVVKCESALRSTSEDELRSYRRQGFLARTKATEKLMKKKNHLLIDRRLSLTTEAVSTDFVVRRWSFRQISIPLIAFFCMLAWSARLYAATSEALLPSIEYSDSASPSISIGSSSASSPLPAPQKRNNAGPNFCFKRPLYAISSRWGGEKPSSARTRRLRISLKRWSSASTLVSFYSANTPAGIRSVQHRINHGRSPPII